MTFDTVVGGTGVTAPAARIKLTYIRTTGALRYDVAASGVVSPDAVVALALQRGDDAKPGPIVAHLLGPNQPAGGGTLMLRGRDREDFVAGTLYLHLYTRLAPLGAGRTKLVLP